jgi:hypothetical protein
MVRLAFAMVWHPLSIHAANPRRRRVRGNFPATNTTFQRTPFLINLKAFDTPGHLDDHTISYTLRTQGTSLCAAPVGPVGGSVEYPSPRSASPVFATFPPPLPRPPRARACALLPRRDVVLTLSLSVVLHTQLPRHSPHHFSLPVP